MPHARATPPAVTEDDRRYMNMALDLAMLAYGKTHPNPHVGCVIVRDGKVRAQLRGTMQPLARCLLEPAAAPRLCVMLVL
jgi:hypothetical protein